ncbi:DUF3551 domain-containing protein [Rubrivivax sp. JA1024]|nr:DUF3551 domain-containing protein [Rubrivivax sp. JA1024]
MRSMLNSFATPRIAAMALASAVAAAGLLAAGSAEARVSSYCLTSPGYGYPGDCSYATYRQCRVAASGRQADCIVNPRAAFREPRHRDYRTYGQGW